MCRRWFAWWIFFECSFLRIRMVIDKAFVKVFSSKRGNISSHFPPPYYFYFDDFPWLSDWLSQSLLMYCRRLAEAGWAMMKVYSVNWVSPYKEVSDQQNIQYSSCHFSQESSHHTQHSQSSSFRISYLFSLKTNSLLDKYSQAAELVLVVALSLTHSG